LRRDYDLVIVGMGSAGLLAAEFAAEVLGLRVAAIERDRLGGDCLWTGCVPSKAVLASAKLAHAMRTAERRGLTSVEPQIDTADVWQRVRRIQQRIAESDDNPERYQRMGVEIVSGGARLVDRHTVDVDGHRLTTRFILLCTGSRPRVPSIDGLKEIGFVSSENVFTRDRMPPSVVFLGGGPVAVEMAQAFRRLGAEVTVLQRRGRLLMRDEPELAEKLTRVLRREGVDIRLNVDVERATRGGGLKVLHGTEAGPRRTWAAEEVFVAAGREPVIEQLELERAGIDVTPRGPKIDGYLRTTASSVYVAGDLTGRSLFTHSAAHESVTAIRNMFFPGRRRIAASVPWCTFTEPELAHAGLTVPEALERHGERRVDVRRIDVSESDRARVEGFADGSLILVSARGRLVGAHVLSPAAGELIHELWLAIRQGTKVRELGETVHVYPTLSTSVARLSAGAAFDVARRYRWLARLRAAL
jgi:pyruvate/2-oxoglutarate dehydrogenase complex dihydrolipoamide dehydrogenase (E3) component